MTSLRDIEFDEHPEDAYDHDDIVTVEECPICGIDLVWDHDHECLVDLEGEPHKCEVR
jgi:hypothetical protein